MSNIEKEPSKIESYSLHSTSKKNPKRKRISKMVQLFKTLQTVIIIGISLALIGEAGLLEAQEREQGSVYMRVVAVNPSKDEAQTVNIKEYLPQEVTTKDVVSTGGLDLEYDTERGLYYVYKEDLEIPAGKTLIFTVELKDIWYIPEDELNTLKTQAENILNQMKDSKDYSTVKKISEEINEQVEEIIASQKESRTLPFKQQVASYRDNIDTLNRMRENIDRMRNFLLATGKGGEGSPAERAMLEASKLKSDVPSKTATWMVIFIIMTFILILGAAFFFAWIRSTRSIEKTTSEATESSFSEAESEPESEEEEEKITEEPEEGKETEEEAEQRQETEEGTEEKETEP
jgi:hypothetical protein